MWRGGRGGTSWMQWLFSKPQHKYYAQTATARSCPMAVLSNGVFQGSKSASKQAGRLLSGSWGAAHSHAKGGWVARHLSLWTGCADLTCTNPVITQIKSAYYQQSLKFHPDHNPGCKTAAENYSSVATAYEVLGQVSLSRVYCGR